MCHVYVNQDGLSAVAISDTDYPNRVAFNMLNKVSFAVICTSDFPPKKIMNKKWIKEDILAKQDTLLTHFF